MSPAAPAVNRRSLIHYAIGLDLVIIVVAAGLLLSPRPWPLLTLFIAAAALAAWRGGWKVGLATTTLSIVALLMVFGTSVGAVHLIVFALAGIVASALLRRRPAPQPAAGETLEQTVKDDAAEVRRAAQLSDLRRRRVVPMLMYVGLPAVVLVIYTNISDVLIRNFPLPSILQPLIFLLAIGVLRYWNVFRPDSIILQPLTLGLIAYLLFVFASSNWARDVAVADVTLTDLLKSFGMLIVPASLAASWKALRVALITIIVCAAVLSVIALGQVAIGDPDLQLAGFAELEVGHVFADVDEARPAGPVRDTNYFARILILAFPLAVFAGVGNRTRKTQLGYTAAAAAIGLGILFTYSRGAMLALAVMAVLVVLAGRIRVTPATVLVAIILVVALIPTTVGRRLATLGNLIAADEDIALDHSTDKRRQLVEVGWLIFNDHPMLGVGAGNFGANYPAYANVAGWNGWDYTSEGVRQFPHNLYLEMAVETGLAGLMVFLVTLILALTALDRSRRALLARGETAHAALVAAIGIAIVGYMVSSIFLHAGYHRYLWLFLGFAAAAVRLTSRDRRAGEEVG